MTSLIVGLGNPGREYEKTRHNIGARCAKELARKFGFELRRKILLKAHVARGPVSGQEVVILLPAAYMNLSGPCVARAIKKYGTALDRLLVLVDDIALPFGQFRLRGHGGTGGHNGLKSIHEALGTDQYARLRIGVGDRTEGDLASHVLSNFPSEEEKLVPKVLEQAVEVIELWLNEGLNRAMNEIN